MLHPAFFFVSSIIAAGVALATALRGGPGLAPKLFVPGLLLLAVESALVGFSASAMPPEVLRFQNLAAGVSSLIPSIWLAFGLVYSRGNYRVFLRQWLPVLAALIIVPLGLAGLFSGNLVVAVESQDNGRVFLLSTSAVVIHIGIILGSVLLLMNLERTFKASVGTMRWNIKFTLLGLIVIFGVRIYTSSQAVLYRSSTPYLDLLNSVALLLGAILLIRALTRESLFRVDVYPSERVLQSSITAILAGAYLLIVGLVSRLVTLLGGDEAFPIKAFFVILALAGLAVLLLSDRLRQRFHDVVARNFARPRYDYRSVWLNLTERTASVLDPRQLSETVATSVSETLRALSVTVWLTDEERTRFERTASTCFTSASSIPANPFREGEIIAQLSRNSSPFIVEDIRESWADLLYPYYLDQFKEEGGSRVCVPLISRGIVVGMITLGDRVSGASYGLEELDLLKCIGDQFASSVLNLKLNSDLVRAKEMEAFQTVCAFFVHDLKNTASSLGLMLQNFRAHIDKPEFREDALRAITKATNHIRELIERLSAVRGQLAIAAKPASLNDVLGSAAECLKPRTGIALAQNLGEIGALAFDAEQLQKVFVNLFLNAAEAMEGRGEIKVETCQQSGWAVVSISDTGCGMSPEFVKNQLFRPFQSTKKGGLGIGMFHSRMIVEAHKGRIEVQTEPGRGTTFRVLLPVVPLPA